MCNYHASRPTLGHWFEFLVPKSLLGYDLGIFNLYGKERIGWSRLGSNYKCPYTEILSTEFLAGEANFELEVLSYWKITARRWKFSKELIKCTIPSINQYQTFKG